VSCPGLHLKAVYGVLISYRHTALAPSPVAHYLRDRYLLISYMSCSAPIARCYDVDVTFLKPYINTWITG
jgi:hypothetical protein